MHILTGYNIQHLQESFNIFEEVSGSPYYYTAFFSNGSMKCSPTNVTASQCLNGVCTASLPSSCYQLNGNISASVSATNSLGEGESSNISYIGEILVTKCIEL